MAHPKLSLMLVTTVICMFAANSGVAADDEIVIIGSQAVLGQFPDAPVEMLRSMEAHLFPRNKPDMSGKIDSAIGEGSSFHHLHGYYAQGVGPETAVFPDGWQERLVAINNENTNGVAGLCLEVNDLAISDLLRDERSRIRSGIDRNFGR